MVHIFWAGGEIEFCILLERFRGGYFVLLLSLYAFWRCLSVESGVFMFYPGLYSYLQDLCPF